MLRKSKKRAYIFQFSSVQSLSHVRLFATTRIAAHQASLSITNSRSSSKLMSMELVMPSNHLIFCRPLLLPPSIFPSIRVFSNESALRMRWPKYWSFSFSISPSSEHPGLSSFRMDWLDLPEVQGTVTWLQTAWAALRNSGKGTQKDICPQEPLGVLLPIRMPFLPLILCGGSVLECRGRCF